MSEFEAITTQEQLDGILKDRLARKDAQSEKAIAELKSQYADYEDLKSKVEKYDAQISELQKSLVEAKEASKTYDSEKADYESKIKAYEIDALKTQIALDNGIYDAKSYIKGETEEDIKKSAEELKNLMGTAMNVSTPMRSTEAGEADGVLAAFRKLNPNLKF